jgi:hypothetical protein
VLLNRASETRSPRLIHSSLVCIAGIKQGSTAAYNVAPTTEKIWSTPRHQDFTRKTRDSLWKSIQNAYKIGDFWLPIEGHQARGICPLCNVVEDMDHILTKCGAKPRIIAWNQENSLWKNKYNSDLPNGLGNILGCGLANFENEGKPNKGKNRLLQILTSETAFIIWKMRNERMIRDNDSTQEPSTSEIRNRWTNAIDKRLTMDRALTDNARFKKRAIDHKLVKATRSGCLHSEEDLPNNWVTVNGGFSGYIADVSPRSRPTRPRSHRRESPTPAIRRHVRNAFPPGVPLSNITWVKPPPHESEIIIT